eukprot:3908182-Rhodomonas_salina.9
MRRTFGLVDVTLLFCAHFFPTATWQQPKPGQRRRIGREEAQREEAQREEAQHEEAQREEAQGVEDEIKAALSLSCFEPRMASSMCAVVETCSRIPRVSTGNRIARAKADSGAYLEPKYADLVAAYAMSVPVIA